MSKPRPIQKLDTAPKFLAGMAGVINSLVKRVNVLSSMEGDGKVVVAITDNNAKVMLGEKSQAAPSSGVALRFIPATLTPSGPLPTEDEIETAIEDAYSTADTDPQEGDIVFMDQFHFLVTGTQDVSGNTIPENGLFRIRFSSIWTAFQIGPNRLF